MQNKLRRKSRVLSTAVGYAQNFPEYIFLDSVNTVIGIKKTECQSSVIDKIKSFQSNNPTQIAISPSNKYLAFVTVREWNHLHIWNLETGTANVILLEHYPQRIIFQNDLKLLVSFFGFNKTSVNKKESTRSYRINYYGFFIKQYTIDESLKPFGQVSAEFLDKSLNEPIFSGKKTFIFAETRIRNLSASIDGKYVAASVKGGIEIWDADNNSATFGKHLIRIEQRIGCLGMKIGGARGLTEKDRAFLMKRGAVLEESLEHIMNSAHSSY